MYYCREIAIFETCFTLVKLFSADRNEARNPQRFHTAAVIGKHKKRH